MNLAADGLFGEELITNEASAQTDFILVNGSAEVSAEPDVAYIHIGVIAQGKTARQAMSEANKKATPFMAKMKERLGANGKIETSTINFQPVYGRQRTPEDLVTQEVVSYKAVHYFDIETYDLTAAGEIIDIGLEDGLNAFRNVRFGLRDDRELQKQALALAVADARAKADALADAANLSIVGVSQIQEGGSPQYGMPMMMSAMKGRSAYSETTLEPGEISVRNSVTVRYRVEGR